MKTAIILARILAGASLLVSVPAWSHGYLMESFPASKTHLNTPPHKIKLRFSVRADAHYSTLSLVQEDGSVLAAKTQQKASRDMEIPAPPLTPGRYYIDYRILSPDGDMVRGKIEFAIDR